jgi:hypothetical protein
MGQFAILPGEHLAEQLHKLGMSAAQLARQLKVPTNRIKCGRTCNHSLKARFSVTQGSKAGRNSGNGTQQIPGSTAVEAPDRIHMKIDPPAGPLQNTTWERR